MRAAVDRTGARLRRPAVQKFSAVRCRAPDSAADPPTANATRSGVDDIGRTVEIRSAVADAEAGATRPGATAGGVPVRAFGVSRLDARSWAQLEAFPVERAKRVEMSMIQRQDPMSAVAAGQHDQ
jgi:hypothetical protein